MTSANAPVTKAAKPTPPRNTANPTMMSSVAPPRYSASTAPRIEVTVARANIAAARYMAASDSAISLIRRPTIGSSFISTARSRAVGLAASRSVRCRDRSIARAKRLVVESRSSEVALVSSAGPLT